MGLAALLFLVCSLILLLRFVLRIRIRWTARRALHSLFTQCDPERALELLDRLERSRATMSAIECLRIPALSMMLRVDEARSIALRYREMAQAGQLQWWQVNALVECFTTAGDYENALACL